MIGSKLCKKTRENISTITFTQNSIIITKKTEEEITYRPTEYYWKQHL